MRHDNRAWYGGRAAPCRQADDRFGQADRGGGPTVAPAVGGQYPVTDPESAAGDRSSGAPASAPPTAPAGTPPAAGRSPPSARAYPGAGRPTRQGRAPL